MESWLPSSVRNILRLDQSHPTFQSSLCSVTIDTVFSKPPKKINPFVYELHEPETEPELEVVFLHDFELGDSQEADWKDWTSGDQTQCWPQTWLVDEFPGARVLSVSYNSNLVKTDTAEKVDMYISSENLGHSLVEIAQVGQSSKCPVVLVGHGLGGLVMKSLCLYIHHLHSAVGRQCGPCTNFSKHLKGLFFYATPHLGSKFFSQNMRVTLSGPFVEDMRPHSVSVARMNDEFRHLQYHHGWHIYGVGETLETEMGEGIRGIVVPEESALDGMWPSYSSIPADHIKICKPDDKNAISFQLLATFIRNIMEKER